MENNHYHWLHANFSTFLHNLGVGRPDWYAGFIGAHGDKFPEYNLSGTDIPHEHGVAIYLLTYISPWSQEVRETDHGWVDPIQWVRDNYERFKLSLPPPFPKEVK